MKKIKVYNLETRKRSYVVVGTSIRDVKEYIEENKRDLDLSFDMSGYYKVVLDNSIFVNWYDMCDENIDVINLTNNKDEVVNYEFATDDAQYNLLLDESLRV